MAQNPSSPLSVSIQPGQHLCVDSRPGTTTQLSNGSRMQLPYFDQFESRPKTHYVSSPFKQGKQTRSQDARMVDPSGELKELTKNSMVLSRNDYKVSLHTFEEIDIKNKTFHTRHRQGRLLPLLGTAMVKGPVINQCIGITSGNHSRSPTKNPRRIKRRHDHFKQERILTENEGHNRLSTLHRESSIHRNSFNSLHHEDTDESSCYSDDACN